MALFGDAALAAMWKNDCALRLIGPTRIDSGDGHYVAMGRLHPIR